jgi:hypothetical protein
VGRASPATPSAPSATAACREIRIAALARPGSVLGSSGCLHDFASVMARANKRKLRQEEADQDEPDQEADSEADAEPPTSPARAWQTQTGRRARCHD